MFGLIVVSAASVLTIAAALVVIDCSTSTFSLFADRAAFLCERLDAVGLGSDPLLGYALVVFGFLALGGGWWLFLKAWRRRRRTRPELSLVENIGRLSDTGQEELAESSASGPVTGEIALRERLAEIERALEGDVHPTREIFTAWLDLLRDVNEHHNAGDLETEDFKVINTRLLALLIAPRPSEGRESVVTS